MTVADIEKIGTPDISRQDARKAFIEYRRAVLAEKDAARRQEYDGLMKGYRAIAAGQQVIDLHKTMHVAGLQPETGYPRLAICRAHATTCHVRMFEDGRAGFRADRAYLWEWSRARMAKESYTLFPRDTFEPYLRSSRRQGWSESAQALVPMVPPALHPARHLRNYHIIWDAVWIKEPPRDPLLVKHLAGFLYAIVAAWDLTPLEQAVMRGRL